MKKRILSTVLAVGILFSCVTVANASTFTQNPQAAQFNAFGGYVKTSASTDKENLVDGWDDTPADNVTPAGNYGTLSQSDTSTGNSYIKIANGTHMVKIFDEVAKSGVLHLSFDYMYGGDESGKVFYVEAIKNSRSNLTGHTAKADGTWTDNVTMVKAIHDGSPLQVLNGATDEAWKSYLDGKWHKFDIVFDFPKSDYIVYADGVKLGTADINNGIKGVEIRDTSTHSKTGIYLDNVALYHYPGVPNMTAVEMAADCGTTGVMSTAGGKLNIGFSEYISGYTPNTADFKITNKASGAVVTAIGAEKTETGVLLTLPALEAGSYEVSFVNESVVGAISGAKISGKAVFAVEGDKIAVAQTTDKNYYLNDDFASYFGGMPTGWVPTLTTANVAAEAAKLEARNGELAVNGGDIAYEFARPVYNNELNIEFDVTTTETGSWGLGILHAKDFYDESAYIAKGYTEKDGDLSVKDTGRTRSLYLGGDTGNEVKINTTRKADFTDVEAEAATLIPGTKTHIKAVVNLNNQTLNVYVGDSQTPIVKTLDKSVFNNVKFYFNNGTATGVDGTQFIGLQGIRLLGNATYDNVKVYANDTYNLNLDFEDMENVTDGSRSLIAKYRAVNEAILSDTKFSASVEADGGNKVLKFTNNQDVNGHWNAFVFPFATPVTKNKPYTVEFDFKQTGNALKDTTAFMLVTEDHFNERIANDTAENNIKAAKRVALATGAFIENKTDETKNTLKAATMRFGVGGEASAQNTMKNVSTNADEDYAIAADTWYNVKLVYGSETNYTLYIKKSTDTAYTAYSRNNGTAYTQDGGSKKANHYSTQKNYDTIGFGLMLPFASATTQAVTYLDNIKVYETNNAYDAQITSAKVTNVDESVEDIGESVTTAARELVFELSEALRSSGKNGSTATYNALDDISMVYADTNKPVGEITLSADKKTITVSVDEPLTAGKNIVFQVAGSALWDDSYLASFDGISKTFSVIQASEKIEVEDFRIYEYQSVTQTVKGNDVTISGWTPVIESTLANQYTADDMFKLSVAGYNTSSIDKDLTAIFAVYKGDKLEDVVLKTVPVPKYKEFEVSIYSANTSESIAGTDAVKIGITPDSKIKCFLWEDIDETCTPVKTNLDYNTWASDAE